MYDISVIIPAFNAGVTIRSCLLSIVSESIAGLQVIVVDDGSTDDTAVIVNDIASRFSCVHYVWQENHGSGSARNHGLSFASGHYVMFVDADDQVEPGAMEYLLDSVRGGDSDVFVCSYVIERDFKERVVAFERYVALGKEATECAFSSLVLNGGRLSVWNKLFRRDLLVSHAISFPDFKRGQDMSFVLSVMSIAASLVVLPRVCYRHLPVSSSSKIDLKASEVYPNLLQQWEKVFHTSKGRRYGRRAGGYLFALWLCDVLPVIALTGDLNGSLCRRRYLVSAYRSPTVIRLAVTYLREGRIFVKVCALLVLLRAATLLLMLGAFRSTVIGRYIRDRFIRRGSRHG